MTAPRRDFVLWGAGLAQSLLAGQVPTSWTLENDGLRARGSGSRSTPAPRRQGHMFIEVAGIVMDTVHGPPTHPQHRPAVAARVEIQPKSKRLVHDRHPQGL